MALRAGLPFVGIGKILGRIVRYYFNYGFKLWRKDVGSSKVKLLRLLCGKLTRVEKS